MKNLKSITKHPFKMFLLISFIMLIHSNCCFKYNKSEKLKGEELVMFNSNRIVSWVNNYWDKHTQFIIGLEYKSKGKYIISELLYPRLPWKYVREIKKGTLKYFGEFNSGDSFKAKASNLSKDFYKNDFTIIALKTKNGIRKVYIKSSFLDSTSN